MKLLSFELNETKHNLIVNKSNDLNNKYTFLVGENGSGKTECLIQIINSLLRYQLQDQNNEKYSDILDRHLENRYKSSLTDFRTKSNLVLHQECEEISISFEKTDAPREITRFDGKKILLTEDSFRYSHSFKTSNTDSKVNGINVIAISESPYNKFPILQSEAYFNYYNIGVNTEENNEYLNHTSNDYVSPKIKQLVSSICASIGKNNNTKFKYLFNLLGFTEKISFTLKIKDSFKYSNEKSEQIAERVISNKYRNTRFSSVAKNTDKEIEDKKNKDKITVIEALNGLNKLKPDYSITKSEINHDAINAGFNLDIDLYNVTLLVSYVVTLIEYDVLFVSNAYFDSKDSEKNTFDANRLSSGQLCLLNLIFGVSSKIIDNSLILIDEPEISLHPHWQAQIIQVINNSFNVYTGCHFIIATHSPHIISNVIKNNSSIVLMGNNENNNAANEIINTEYGCQGWTIEEILQDVMGMSDTRTDEYHQKIKGFEDAIEQENYISAKAYFSELDSLLHPNNHLRKLLKLELASIKVDAE
jgi:predicted ATPase